MSVFNAYELYTLKWSILLCILYPDWVFQCALYLLISFYIGSMVDLQCCLRFRCAARGISYTYTYIQFFSDSFPILVITEY